MGVWLGSLVARGSKLLGDGLVHTACVQLDSLISYWLDSHAR